MQRRQERSTGGKATICAVLALALLGCTQPAQRGPAGSQDQARPEVGRPRHIEIVGSEATDNFWLFGERDTVQSAFVDGGLVGQNANNLEMYPWLAEEVPSLDRGTWKLDRANGTSETTFRLRPGMTWHDGTPFTSADFKFGWEVALDTNVPLRERTTATLVSSIDTPDDRTIVVKWRTLFKRAGTFQKQDLRHLPRHLLEGPYRDAVRTSEYTQFLNHPHWNRDFVGLGPYRLVDYGDGTDWRMQAFDGYALGRPRIDTIRYRVIEDVNTVLTGLLAGTIDVAIGSASAQTALVLKEQWERPGMGTVLVTPISSRYLSPSFNPWLNDARVRRALLHAIDREAINQNLWGGLTQVMHMPLNPLEPRFAKANAVATRYPHDFQAADRLMQEAGWRKGPDGVLANAQGERFAIPYRANSGDREQEQTQVVVIDFWKQIGVETEIANLPSRVASSQENRGRWPGVSATGGNVSVAEYEQRWHTRQVPTEATRWVGGNVNQWSVPRVDAILDELDSLITPQREEELVVEFIRIWTAELPALPLVFSVDIIPVKKGVSGVIPRIISGGNGLHNWNVHQWDIG